MVARRSHVVEPSAAGRVAGGAKWSRGAGGVAGGAKWSQLVVEAARGRIKAAAVDGPGEQRHCQRPQSRGAGGRSRGAARRALLVVEPECDQSQQRHRRRAQRRQSQRRSTAGAGWMIPAIERLQC